MYVLDTNVLSALRRPDRAPQLTQWLRSKPEDALFLSVITLGEIERGINQQQKKNPEFAADLRGWIDRTTLLFGDRLLDFSAEDARIWGRLSARLGHAGADLLIAATALAHGATIITFNVKDFEPTGVDIENPF
ncbi:type II toxin-antitoxin system VapC family toxin [Pseudogemmobacter sp. W21_MBD1_M6]|uniref:type II toxin-antitoxin system VapC family toxin n=1 Tax=Pseudogemmobacter sp. W21_MBD1_M6 TaxID=3240271 RepID=UPI003F99B60D